MLYSEFVATERLQVFEGDKELICAYCGKKYDLSMSLHEYKLKIGQKKFYCSYACRNSVNPNPRDGGKLMDYDWVYEQYVTKKKSCYEIGRMAERAGGTVCAWLKRHGIPIRSLAENSYLFANRGEKNGNWAGGKSRCKVCNCELPVHYGDGKKHFCQECYFKEGMTGKNNWRYKGTVDIYDLVRAYSKTYWRPRVFERDKYQCVECGDSKGGNLCAHHLIPFSSIIDNAIQRYTTDTPEQRAAVSELLCNSFEINDLDNGVTLCESCHIEKHAKNPNRKVKKISPRELIKTSYTIHRKANTT